MSRVGCPDGKDASSLRQPSVHAVVDRVDPRYYCQGLSLRFETESQHRVEGAVKTPHPAPALGAKSAVVGDTASHERMRELEQNGRAPAEKKDDLPLKLPGYGAHAGGHVPRVRSRDAAKPITRVKNGVRSPQRPAHRSSRP